MDRVDDGVLGAAVDVRIRGGEFYVIEYGKELKEKLRSCKQASIRACESAG